MRRASRFLVTALCLLSATASAAAIVLWVRSFRVGETYHFPATPAPPANAAPLPGKPDTWVYQYHLACGGGQVQLVRRNMATSDVKQLGYRRADLPNEALSHLTPGGNAGGSGWRIAQFEYYRNDRRYISMGMMQAWVWGFVIIGVPLWLLAVVFGIPPVVWLLRHRAARRRRRSGLCPGCGYDLRASRQFGRCPECGRATPRATAAPPAPSAPASDDRKHADVTSTGPTPTS
jgi:hypothetical protein